MQTVQTSLTVTAQVIGEVSSNAIATTTQIINEPTFWDSIVGFLMFWI